MNTAKNHKKSTVINAGSDKPKSKVSAHYVSNSDLYDEYVKWYAKIDEASLKGLPEPPVPNTIGMAIIQIAENFSKKANWISNTKWKDEMIGAGIEDCCKGVKNFDITKSKNPFSYFTQTCFYAFLRTIEKEKKEDYVKHKMMLNALQNNLHIQVDDEDAVDLESMEYNQKGIEEFIKDFEIKKFGEELALDETAGLAGKRRKISNKQPKEKGLF